MTTRPTGATPTNRQAAHDPKPTPWAAWHPTNPKEQYMDTSIPTIPPETANHVLHHFGRGGYPAGTFTQHLIAALCSADMDNKTKLANAYPDYAAAVIAMEYDPDGATNLQRIAGGAE